MHEDSKNIIFFSSLDTVSRRTTSAWPACLVLISNQAGQSLCVEWVCPILKKLYFWKSYEKLYNISAIKIRDVVGTPNLSISPLKLEIFILDTLYQGAGD